MSHAELILRQLDSRLNAPVELTLYGRAALQLGFADPLPEYALSRDVDAVLWIGQAEELAETSNFWEAVEDVNRLYAERDLYISHFFEEDQVILRPDWRQHRLRIGGEWSCLTLFRLGDLDLLLSKLMRDDPVDLADARFIVARAGLGRAEIENACREARVPEIAEIRQCFARCIQRLLG